MKNQPQICYNNNLYYQNYYQYILWKNFMSLICTNSHYGIHATFVPSINHNKDVALLSYVELYNDMMIYLLNPPDKHN